MFLAMAALGLPGLGSFVAEFLILMGVFKVSRPAAVVGAVGLVFATVYALWLVQRVFHGPSGATPVRRGRRRDLSWREMVVMAATVIILLWLGLYPQAFVRTAKETTDSLLHLAVPPAASQSLPGETTGAAGPMPMTPLPSVPAGLQGPPADAASEELP